MCRTCAICFKLFPKPVLMAKYIMALTILLSVATEGVACDACGCSISGHGIGLLTNFRTNVAGVRYFNTPFQTAPTFGSTNDRFHLLEAFVRYQVNPRIKLTVTQPYRLNYRHDKDAETLHTNGISDTRLMGSYAFVDERMGAGSRLYWELGAGVKLPVGKYDNDLHKQDLPDNFNIGNGSWGYLFQSGLVFSANRFGVSFNAATQLNGKTSSGYRFGSQFSGSMLFFAEKTLGEKGRIVPLAGLSGELVSKDQHANGNEAHGTGGKGFLLWQVPTLAMTAGR